MNQWQLIRLHFIQIMRAVFAVEDSGSIAYKLMIGIFIGFALAGTGLIVLMMVYQFMVWAVK